MLNKIKYYWQAAWDKYFIQVAYVEQTKGSTIPTVVEKKFIIYNDDNGKMDYTDDPKKATCFGIVLGMLIVNQLRKECEDLKNLQFDLVTVQSAMFVDTVSGGAAVGFISGNAPIDHAVHDLVKKYMKQPGIVGIGSQTKINADKKIIEENYIVIHVKDDATIQKLKSDFPGNVYKGFPVKIEIGQMPKAQNA